MKSVTSLLQYPDRAHHSVPMQLPQSSFCEMLLSSSDVFAGGQIGHNLFSDPTSGKEPCLGVREAPFEIGDYSIVRSLGAEIIRVLEVQWFVRSACVESISFAGLLIAYIMVMATKGWLHTQDRTPIALGVNGLALCELLTFFKYWA